MSACHVAAVLLVAAVGCGSRQDAEGRRAFSSVDSWYSPPPARADFVRLGKDQFATVADTLQPEAQVALADTPFKSVSAEEAVRLTGKQLPAGGQYVLLRAVVLNEKTGGFDVEVGKEAVHVHHGCLGRRAVPMTRKALVAVLPSVPEAVYISCSMAE
jgi:hypothetical protein